MVVIADFRHRDRFGFRSGISTDTYIGTYMHTRFFLIEANRTEETNITDRHQMQSTANAKQRRAGFGTYHPASPPQKYAQKNALTNRFGIFCESGIRACPESVGVDEFCRLRIRDKQPTLTDSDSYSAAVEPTYYIIRRPKGIMLGTVILRHWLATSQKKKSDGRGANVSA